jgi:AcrR family transcriptional regulator
MPVEAPARSNPKMSPLLEPETGSARPDGPKKEDGRALRSATTRRAVAEAYLNLLDGGDLRPTARAIAAEAGVSERAVFRHFQDMETLHSEAAVLQIQRVAETVPQPAGPGGPLRDRADAVTTRWGTINERVTPVRRVALLHEPFSAEVARRLGWVRGVAKAEIEATFAAELAALDAERRKEAVAALSAAASWESWNEVRVRHGLDVDAARRTTATMLVAILGAFAVA